MAVQSVSGENKVGLRPLDPVRDLSQLADLIECAFGEELTDEGLKVLRELRLLAVLGPLNVFVIGAQSEINDLFTGFVWVQENRVIGNVTVNRPTGHPKRWQISNVAVLEAYRRQGIARQLIEAAIDFVLAQGGNATYLYVQEANAPARHLYESVGFVEMDRLTDLTLNESILRSRVPLSCLRILNSQEDEQLYKLVLEADSVARRWLFPVQRGQYVTTPAERFSRRIEAFLFGETETHWGMFNGDRLDVGLVLHTTSGLNRRGHRLKLWVRPRQSQLDQVQYLQIAQDIAAILSRKARRPAHISLPASESKMIDALARYGFQKRRTLVMMILNL